jgi:hypothetical protein
MAGHHAGCKYSTDADNRDEIYVGIEITGAARFFNGTVQRFIMVVVTVKPDAEAGQ